MGTLASSRISQTRFRFVSTKQRKAKKGFLMVAKKVIAWSKATLHAIVIPVALALLPYGWIAALGWIAFPSWLYATTFKKRPAAYPFFALAYLIVVPTLIAFEAIKIAMAIEPF
jgi:hypothetical protein